VFLPLSNVGIQVHESEYSSDMAILILQKCWIYNLLKYKEQ